MEISNGTRISFDVDQSSRPAAVDRWGTVDPPGTVQLKPQL
jgi:hypothetical protein